MEYYNRNSDEAFRLFVGEIIYNIEALNTSDWIKYVKEHWRIIDENAVDKFETYHYL